MHHIEIIIYCYYKVAHTQQFVSRVISRYTLIINTFYARLQTTVKPVYSGHLGEFDKMTTICR